MVAAEPSRTARPVAREASSAITNGAGRTGRRTRVRAHVSPDVARPAFPAPGRKASARPGTAQDAGPRLKPGLCGGRRPGDTSSPRCARRAASCRPRVRSLAFQKLHVILQGVMTKARFILNTFTLHGRFYRSVLREGKRPQRRRRKDVSPSGGPGAWRGAGRFCADPLTSLRPKTKGCHWHLRAHTGRELQLLPRSVGRSPGSLANLGDAGPGPGQIHASGKTSSGRVGTLGPAIPFESEVSLPKAPGPLPPRFQQGILCNSVSYIIRPVNKNPLSFLLRPNRVLGG